MYKINKYKLELIINGKKVSYVADYDDFNCIDYESLMETIDSIVSDSKEEIIDEIYYEVPKNGADEYDY